MNGTCNVYGCRRPCSRRSCGAVERARAGDCVHAWPPRAQRPFAGGIIALTATSQSRCLSGVVKRGLVNQSVPLAGDSPPAQVCRHDSAQLHPSRAASSNVGPRSVEPLPDCTSHLALQLACFQLTIAPCGAVVGCRSVQSTDLEQTPGLEPAGKTTPGACPSLWVHGATRAHRLSAGGTVALADNKGVSQSA